MYNRSIHTYTLNKDKIPNIIHLFLSKTSNEEFLFIYYLSIL